MKHDYKKKIEVLNEILKEYAKYFVYFNECKCYDVGLRFIIIFKSSKGKRYDFLMRKIPRADIDKIIARYRSKLSHEVKKYTRNDIKKPIYIKNIPERVLNFKFF